MYKDIDAEIEDFFKQGEEEIDAYLSSIGEESVEANKRDGNYHNRTGRLRNSNYYKVSEHSLQIGNDAPYASEVSNRGYNVIDSGIQLLKKKVEDNL